MADNNPQAQSTQSQVSDRGHPMPRRATHEASVTLRHHRMARDASMKPSSLGTGPVRFANLDTANSPGDSLDTGHSDPKNWFDRSNKNNNPSAAFDQSSMDGMCELCNLCCYMQTDPFQSIPLSSKNRPTRPTKIPALHIVLDAQELSRHISSKQPHTAAAPTTIEASLTI